tara:strand:+ start:1926 stop:2159 length:234 start_codon:yes stop_codon:yes gene_type:complete
MQKTQPSRPTKVARKKPLPKVSKPEPLNSDNDIAKPTSIAAKPLIGAEPDFVTTVGLGNLKVTTANGILNNDRETNV